MTERTLQRYRLLEEVGQGGMAVVYKGLDTTLNREVAVKVLHPHLAGQEESRARLQREAHAVAKLRHENILEIFDYSGPDSPESYIVTEFIHGRTLKNFLTEHPLPFPEVAEMIASEVARALEHAHSLGVIHRDIKPENVMIRDDGLVKLMDFGIAQIVDKERMTVTGQLLGSPAYMAPEHVEGRALDFRTDVFAVGILTYQLATGQLPFRGKNPHEVLKKIAECKFAPPESVNPLVGKRLARVIEKALQRDPAARFADVAPMRRELLDDLADAGVEDARAELQKFFADPKGWARDFKPRLVERLTARGRERRTGGRLAAALELWGRALNLEPKSTELRALVDGAARHPRRGRLAIVGAGAIALAAAAGFAVRYARGPANDPKPLGLAPVAVRAETPPLKADAPKMGDPGKTAPIANPSGEPGVGHFAPTGAAAKHPGIHHAAVVPPAHAPQPSAPEAAPQRTITLAPSPQNVNVVLDGKALGAFNPDLTHVSIGPGEHTFEFSSEFCFNEAVKIAAGDPSREVRVRLKWKPAALTIQTAPPGADVLVDGEPSHSGLPIPVKIPDHAQNGRRTVAVKVSARGYESRTLDVVVRANESHEEKVELVEARPE